ncbi:hypothetical protein L596_020990 [Steinernema carpocapsae]|uniref:Uncharacterized protein n=1 Tax=Steinernema carpocapsae TaxID=34508 RepID=A0A4U5MVT5_STECR|nr:hypothetical protein L596_020990 [Steinernema carpocapsae]
MCLAEEGAVWEGSFCETQVSCDRSVSRPCFLKECRLFRQFIANEGRQIEQFFNHHCFDVLIICIACNMTLASKNKIKNAG